MLKVAVLVDNTLQHDRRALMELQTLSKLPIDLTVFCNSLGDFAGDDVVNGIKVKRVFTEAHWQYKSRRLLNAFADELVRQNFGVLHCHDHFMLHIGALVKQAKPKTVLVYESRELFFSYPVHFFNESMTAALKSNVVRRLQVARERRNMTFVDHVITVNDGIADLIQRRFRRKEKPVVLRNTGPLRVPTANNVLRDEMGIAADRKIIAYIGSNVFPRVLQLEKLIDQIRNRIDYALVIVANDNVRRRWFENFVKRHNVTNVFFRDMVAVDQVENYLAGCDVGLVAAWNKKDLSYWHALDNKLFSYIMACIPVLATAQPEYIKIVEGHDVGVCVNPDNPNAFVVGLEQIEKRRGELKRNAQKARLRLNWENEEKTLVAFYERLAASA